MKFQLCVCEHEYYYCVISISIEICFGRNKIILIKELIDVTSVVTS